MIRPKVVVALYPFRAIEGGDLSLEKVSVLKKSIKFIATECLHNIAHSSKLLSASSVQVLVLKYGYALNFCNIFSAKDGIYC